MATAIAIAICLTKLITSHLTSRVTFYLLQNAALWCPKFFLPTIDSILRNASKDTWFGDLDLGEMFLNFWLDEQLRPYAGVDVKLLGERKVDKDGNDIFVFSPLEKTLWERWK